MGGSECPAEFSSNFLGGRKGSIFHKRQLGQQVLDVFFETLQHLSSDSIVLWDFVFTKGI